MKLGKRWIYVSVLAAMCGQAVLAADEMTPSTQPAEQAAGGHHRRLIQPYAKLTGLTDEQKEKIEAIHAQTLADRKAMEEKEKSEIAAVLNDDQRTELTKLEETAAMERKERGASRRNKKMDENAASPTTEPAQ